MESTPRPGLTRRAFFAALFAPFLARFAKLLPEPRPALGRVRDVVGLSTLTITGGSTELRLGDVFTISGTSSYNPMRGSETGIAQRFIVTAVAASGRRGRTLEVWPAMILRGPYQTIAELPRRGAELERAFIKAA